MESKHLLCLTAFITIILSFQTKAQQITPAPAAKTDFISIFVPQILIQGQDKSNNNSYSENSSSLSSALILKLSNQEKPAIGGGEYDEEDGAFRPEDNVSLYDLSDTTMLRLSTLGGRWGYSLYLDTLSVSLSARKNLLREDPTNYDNVMLKNIAMVSEGVAIDCVWITMREYYKTWNSDMVNPYNIDASKFKDTLQLALYDSTMGRYWSSPMATNDINSNFGYRRYRWHHGIDLDLETGDPVYSVFDGVVRIKKYSRGFGNHVVVRHYNGLETVYGHLSATDVEVGQYVKAGQMLGKGGSTGRSTGPHLHFEVRFQGNSIDPSHIFDFEKNQIKVKDFELSAYHFTHLGARVHGSVHKHRATAKGALYHIVRSGESLWTISRKYRTSISAICRLNKISPRTTLRIGRRLRVR